MKNICLIYSFILVLLLALASSGQIKSGLVKKELKDSEISDLVQQSDMIISVEVRKVGISPMRWSGFVSSMQIVDYKIKDILKGELNLQNLSVGFLLDKSSPMVEENNPKLSKSYFYNGHKHLIFIKVAEERYYDIPKGKNKSTLYLSPDDYIEIIIDKNSFEYAESIIQSSLTRLLIPDYNRHRLRSEQCKTARIS